LLAGLAAAQFVVFEAALRWHGGSEASPAFQRLFRPDPYVGHVLAPDVTTRFTTAEFSTTIAINPQGIRDDEPVGPKEPGERRIVVLGDSIVFAVQVEHHETFCELLEARLNARGDGTRYRVLNAGVQGTVRSRRSGSWSASPSGSSPISSSSCRSSPTIPSKRSIAHGSSNAAGPCPAISATKRTGI